MIAIPKTELNTSVFIEKWNGVNCGTEASLLRKLKHRYHTFFTTVYCTALASRHHQSKLAASIL